MTSSLRRVVHRYVPGNLEDPVGLAARIVRSGSPDAYFAAATAALGLLATPMDLLLQMRERRLYSRASVPQRPIVFVAGAPRSGTTLVAQMLIRHLPVAYISNLSAVFPRSPLTASQLFGVRPRNDRVVARSYYGRTRHFWGPNDALHIWDRWMGSDRARPPAELRETERKAMRQFFGALEAVYQRPVLNKNNSLNVVAHVVADALETARFVCVTRDPLYLAQSLLKARLEIHGGEQHCYGVAAPEDRTDPTPDPFRQVCRQALYHNALAQQQLSAIGPDRFWICSYEQFCERPADLIAAVADQWLGRPPLTFNPHGEVQGLRASNSRKLPPADFERLSNTLAKIANS